MWVWFIRLILIKAANMDVYIVTPEIAMNIGAMTRDWIRSEEHTSELQSRPHLVCRLLLEKKKKKKKNHNKNIKKNSTKTVFPTISSRIDARHIKSYLAVTRILCSSALELTSSRAGLNIII